MKNNVKLYVILLLLLIAIAGSVLADNYSFITKWGSLGSGNGQFNGPHTIAVDGSGFVYVSDQYDRIQKFNTNGTFITSWVVLVLEMANLIVLKE